MSLKNHLRKYGKKVNDIIKETPNCDIPTWAVDRAHRIGQKTIAKVSNKKVQSIIVRFVTFRHRTMLYRARKSIGNLGKIRLDLTKRRYGILKDAINIANKSEMIGFVYEDVNCRLKAHLIDGHDFFLHLLSKIWRRGLWIWRLKLLCRFYCFLLRFCFLAGYSVWLCDLHAFLISFIIYYLKLFFSLLKTHKKITFSLTTFVRQILIIQNTTFVHQILITYFIFNISPYDIISLKPSYLQNCYFLNSHNSYHKLIISNHGFCYSYCTLINNNSTLSPFGYKANSKFDNISFTENEIISSIRSLNHNKAHGWDAISIRMIKMCDESIVFPLQSIFESALKFGVYPDKWKKANVIPVHKKGSKNLLKNYRYHYYLFVVRFLKSVFIILFMDICNLTTFYQNLNQVFVKVILVYHNCLQ